MSYAQTIAIATDLLAEGRAADVVQMVAPLVDAPLTTDADPDTIRLHALLARVDGVHSDNVEAALQRLEGFDDRAARASLDDPLRAEVALWLGWAYARKNAESEEDARALRLLEEAGDHFAQSHAPHGRCWALIGQAQAYFALDEYDLMRRTLQEAADLHARTQDAQADAWIHDLHVPALRFQGRYDEAQTHVDALLDRAASMDDRRLRGRATAHQAALEFDQGRPPAHVIETAKRAETLLRALDGRPGYPLLAAYHTHISALVRQGAWEQAETRIGEAESAMQPYPLAQTHLQTLRARLAYRRGQCEKAGQLLERVVEHAHRLPHGLQRSHVALLRGELLAHWNEYDDARDWMERAVRNARDTGHRGNQLHALLTLAAVAQEHDDWATAADAIARADAYDDYFSVLPFAVARFRAIGQQAEHEGRSNDARVALTQALSAASLIGDAYETARLQVALARVDTAAPRQTRPLLDAAAATFDRLGATRDRAYAQSLLDTRAEPASESSPDRTRVTEPSDPEWTAQPVDASLGAHLARASLSVELVAEAWLQAVEHVLPGRWMAVYRATASGGWSCVHAHGAAPPAVADDDAAGIHDVETCENVRWIGLHDGPPFAFRMGVEADPETWHAARSHLDPWLPVVRLALDRALLRQQRIDTAASTSRGSPSIPVDGFVAESPAMQRVAQHIDRIRTSHSPVLVTGERGVGKELVANAIHHTSTRSDEPVAHVQCASMQHAPLEVRLFGRHRSDGTLDPGAAHDAANGTLVLHDVDALSGSLQAALLRLLDTGAVVPVGASRPVRADARVVALTATDLAAAVSEGTFRKDLYHHLNVIQVRVPPLNARREDIPLLTRFFLNDLRPEGAPMASITNRALEALLRYDWPGNVRQLRNEIERALVFVGNEPAPTIDVQTLSDAVAASVATPPPTDDSPSFGGLDLDTILRADTTLRDLMADAETAVIERALRSCDGQVTATADVLGLSRQGLYKKMKRLDIAPAEFQAKPSATSSSP